MTVSINPPKTPVTEGSSSVAAATVPNVCKMPGPPAPFVPAPLPNIGKCAMSPKGYSKNVTIEGKKVAIKGATFKSMGDIASKGTGGGLISAQCEGVTSFVGPGSPNVTIEGKAVQFLGDPMLNNGAGTGTPANAATLVGVVHAPDMVTVNMGDEPCPACDDPPHGEAAKLAESGLSKSAVSAMDGMAKAAMIDAEARRKQLVQEAFDKQTQALAREEEKNWKRVRGKDSVAAAASVKKIAEIKARVMTPEIEASLNVATSVSMETMLGAAVCDDSNVYAAQSNLQMLELAKQVAGPYHFPVPTSAIVGGLSGATPQPQLPMSAFQAHATGNPDGFDKAWQKAEKAVDDYDEGKGQPAYPPGNCAGQRAVVLALDHGARVTGLSERWFVHANPLATTPVGHRTPSNPATVVKPFGGKDSVPPCGSCQAVLGALLCPKDRPPKCEHKSPSEGACAKCHPPKSMK